MNGGGIVPNTHLERGAVNDSTTLCLSAALRILSANVLVRMTVPYGMAIDQTAKP